MLKRSFALHALLFVLAMTSCSKNNDVSSAIHEPTAADGVQLVFWNDFHSGLYESVNVKTPDIAIGGLPVWMSAVEYLKGDGLSLVLDAGDMFQGATPLNELKGMGTIEIMNAVGVDAATLGNHEFDYGPNAQYPDSPQGALTSAIAASKFAWVDANVHASSADNANWPPQGLKPYTIINKGPYRIAVTGVTTVETRTTTNTLNIAGIEFENPAQALTRVIPEIVKEDPDFIIVLGHLTGAPTALPEFNQVTEGAQFSDEIGEIMALPDEIKGKIGLLVTGHLHISFLAKDGEKILSQGLASGNELTAIKLVPKKEGKGLEIAPDSIHKYRLTHKPIYKGCGVGYDHPETLEVGGLTLKPDERGYALTTKFEEAMSEGLCDVIACTAEPFYRNPEGESAIANIVANAEHKYYPEADAVLMNAGSLRTDWGAGTLYRETVTSMMPFDNKIVLAELTGQQIIDVLKVSSTLHHRIMEVSGIQYAIQPNCGRAAEDLDKNGTTDNWEVSCLCSGVMIGGESIDVNKKYKVAMSDFIFNGGDSLEGILKSAVKLDEGPVIKQLLNEYLKSFNACLTESQFIDSSSPRITTTGTCSSFL